MGFFETKKKRERTKRRKREGYGSLFRTVRVKCSKNLSQVRIRQLIDMAKASDLPKVRKDLRKTRCFNVSNEQEVKLRDLALYTNLSYTEIIDALLEKFGIEEDVDLYE